MDEALLYTVRGWHTRAPSLKVHKAKGKMLLEERLDLGGMSELIRQ